MPISKEKLTNLVKNSFPNAEIQIEDTVGDQNHYSLYIKDTAFAGKTLVAQHQMVNKALKEYLSSGELHALSIKTASSE